MIVPFLFTLDEYSSEYPTYLWVFYKFLDFAKRNNFPIIAQEKFLDIPDSNHSALNKEWADLYNYTIPNSSELSKYYKYCISDDEISQIIKKHEDIKSTWVNILKRSNSILEKIILDKIKKIEQDYDKKIEAIITWVWNPSLEKVALENNIKIIQMELSTIRKKQYDFTLGYFQFCDKYSSKEINKMYKLFDLNKNLILDRKSILSLFLSEDKLFLIKKMFSQTEFKIGYALGLPNDCFEKVYSKSSINEIINYLDKNYYSNEILIRCHPAAINDIKINYSIDNSLSASDWICRCETIINNISNIGYESSLYGKRVINISDKIPSSYGQLTNLNNFEGEIMSLDKLNFITFAWYVPYDLMFDLKYIKWRLSNPNINEIYEFNLTYILKHYNIDYKTLIKMDKKNRLEYILKSKFSLDEQILKKILSFSEQSEYLEYKNLNKEYNKVKRDLDYIYKEYMNLINSPGWKVTKKFRKFVDNLKDKR